MLVFAAVLTYGVVSHSPTLLAAELSLDHLKCFALLRAQRRARRPRRRWPRQLEQDYGWRLRVPGDLPSQQLTLLGARRCLSTDGQVAHVLYRHAGRPVSLFIMPRTTRPEARVARRRAASSRIWSRGDTSYVLLGDETERELQPIAEYFKGVL